MVLECSFIFFLLGINLYLCSETAHAFFLIKFKDGTTFPKENDHIVN